jgi:hypothetical protein
MLTEKVLAETLLQKAFILQLIPAIVIIMVHLIATTRRNEQIISIIAQIISQSGVLAHLHLGVVQEVVAGSAEGGRVKIILDLGFLCK